jgi:hypothetical protein
MNRIKLALSTVLLVTPLAAQIQIPLDSLAAKAKETKGIALDQAMLKLAGNFLAGDKAQDPTFQKILDHIKSILVKRFSFAEEGAYKDAELEPLRSMLHTTGWARLINVHKDNVSREVYLKPEGGLTVLVSRPKEVVIVSVEGVIDLATLAGLAGHLGIPQGLTDGIVKPNPDAAPKPDAKNP